ncbi:MAG: METTL5 family protein [Thermoplasmata archaeon]
MNRKQLEIQLQRVHPYVKPSARFEQYSTPADIASDMLWTAFMEGNIQDRIVADLGCGTGVLGIGASLLGAKEVIGVDLDARAIEIAIQNAIELKVNVRFEVMKVWDFQESVDTVVQNPPFGAQKKHADMPFLMTGMNVAEVVYSLHLSETEEFVRKRVEALGNSVEMLKHYIFVIPHTYEFHRKEKVSLDVTLFRIRKGKVL